MTITGRQFAWTIEPPRVRAHLKTKIELNVVDVNHAMGIYDPDGTPAGQLTALRCRLGTA